MISNMGGNLVETSMIFWKELNDEFVYSLFSY